MLNVVVSVPRPTPTPIAQLALQDKPFVLHWSVDVW